MSGLLRLSVAVAVLLAALALAACGGKKTRLVPQLASEKTPPTLTQPATAISLDETLAELDALETPEGVDETLWGELKDALASQLESRPAAKAGKSSNRDSLANHSRLESRDSSDTGHGVAKLASTPPTGAANRVTDLAIADNGDGTFTLSWHYRNLGDYDQNGVVGISDITPLAIHFGEEVPSDDINRNSIQAVIDGSENSVVDIADIVVLAQRLATHVVDYALEGAQSLDGAYSFVQAIGLEAAATDGRLLISHTVSQVGFKCVRVSPTDASGTAGEPSNAVFMPATGRGDWYMFGRDAQHSHTSPYIGPRRNPVVKWKLDIGDRLRIGNKEYPCPAIGVDGTVYLMGYGRILYAVNPDGTVKWQSETSATRRSNPAIGVDGTVYVAGSMLQAFSPSGAVLWEYDLHPYPAQSDASPLIGPDGTIYVGCYSLFSDFTHDAFLYAVNPDGSTKWMSRGVGGYNWNAPAMCADGAIYSAYMGGFCAVSPEGQLRWQYETPLYYFGPTLDERGNIYLRNTDNHLLVFSSDGESLLDVNMGDDYPTWSMPLASADGTIYIGNNDAYYYALNPDGSVKWKYETCYDVESTAVLDAENRIYFGCDGGFLYCLEPDGTLVWRLDVGSSVQSVFVMAADGTLYFVTYDGFLCAVAEDPGGEPPQAVMSVSPMWGPAPLEVSFDSSLSDDPDGKIVLYEWDLDGDGKFEQSSETELTASRTFTENGQHTVSLRVTDEQGLSDTASRTIIVRDDDARGDWWMFGHDPQHTRRSPFVGPQTATVKWKYDLGRALARHLSSPAVASDGTIYIGSPDYHLHALNPNGTLKWKYETESSIRSSPAIAPSGVVYVGSDDNHFYAINPDGSLNWRRRMGYTVVSSPVVAPNGTIYVGCSDTYLYAFSPDGSIKWRFKTDDWICSSPAISDGGTIYVCSTDGYLYALNPDGSMEWCFRAYYGIQASPCIALNGSIYISWICKLFAVSKSGFLRWIYKLDNSYSNPALYSDDSVCSVDRSTFYRFLPDGTIAMTCDLPIDPPFSSLSSPAIGVDGTAYVGYANYAGGDCGILTVTSDGHVLWQYETRADVSSSPALAEDGTLYIGCDDGYLYAFADESGT